jgi:DEAD/DEAH box helicase domain-containing protein
VTATTTNNGPTLLDRLGAGKSELPSLVHVEYLPARAGTSAPWPGWTPEPLRSAWQRMGIEAPWRHQTEAAELAHSGRSVVIATGTASGKSLAYQLPMLAALLADPRATALYLTPTKALAADQLATLSRLEPPDVRPACYDGDTEATERDWVRKHSRLVLTNPDMLHQGVLPRHPSWSSFLRRLTYVVVDECHAYRGVFGSHVAHVLRRLRRICQRYGSRPVFVLASATTSDPAVTARRLTGLRCAAITTDTAPRGELAFALWEPPLGPGRGEGGAPVRRPATAECADLLADLVAGGVRTLAFVRSRRAAEVVALQAQRALAEVSQELADRVAAYRGGYLPEDRRALERAFGVGELHGLAATNALELGIDVAGLDAVLLAGYPGRLASLWQQAGRAGRAGSGALAVLVARDDPLDTYLVHHPEAIFSRPVEATVLDPGNPYVLAPQLCYAAAELPLTAVDLELFGGDDLVRPVLADLVTAGALRRRPAGWFWATPARPRAGIRGGDGEPISVCDSRTGRLLGTVEAGSAHATLHEGAVHLHRGDTFVVDELRLDDAVALVHRDDPDYTTHARELTEVEVVATGRTVLAGAVRLTLGTVDVTGQVVSYLRRRLSTGEVIDECPLDLPPRHLRTTAVWYTLGQPLDVAGLTISPADLSGALHAAEHAAIGLLPLVATCDRWDVGGLSTALHPSTGLPTVFVHDGHPGGAGFAERGFDAALEWFTATRDAISSCGCPSGCPSCVQSPKCGNGNEPLHKQGAIEILSLLVKELVSVGRGGPPMG